jgi:hypothetical protein
MGKLGDTQKKTAGTLSKLKLGYLAVAGVLTGVVAKAFAGALKSASAFEEANSKFGVVFRGVSKEANAMRRELVDSYGVSTLAATEMLSGIQDFLVPMGIARDEASELSGNFAKLAVDIGSFNNAPTAEVLQAIKSGLAGQSEPLRRFGVDVSENTLKQMALAQGIKLVNGRLDRSTRAQLLYQKIVEDSSDALGDFARTQNSTANIMKRAQAVWEDITLIFGQELAKEIQPVVDGLNDLISTETGMNKLRKGFKSFFILLRFIGQTLRFTVFEPMILSIKTAIEAVKGVAEVSKSVLKGNFKEIGGIIKTSFKNFTEPAKETFKDLKDVYTNIALDTADLFKTTNEDAIEGINNVVDVNKDADQQIVESKMATAEQLRQIKELEKMALEEDMIKAKSTNAELQAMTTELADKRISELQRVMEAENMFFTVKRALQREDVQATKDALSDISSLTESTNKTLFQIGKASSIANAIMNNAEAITKTMTSVPFPFNVPLAIGQGVAGAVQINKISNTKFQGKAQGGVVDQVMGSPMNGEDGFIGIQRGESVLTREATVNLGRSTIDQINRSGGRGGVGAPQININVSNPNPMETVNVINDYMRQYGDSESGVSL